MCVNSGSVTSIFFFLILFAFPYEATFSSYLLTHLPLWGQFPKLMILQLRVALMTFLILCYSYFMLSFPSVPVSRISISAHKLRFHPNCLNNSSTMDIVSWLHSLNIYYDSLSSVIHSSNITFIHFSFFRINYSANYNSHSPIVQLWSHYHVLHTILTVLH